MFRKLLQKLGVPIYLAAIKSRKGFDALILNQLKNINAFDGICTASFRVNENLCNDRGHLDNGFSTTLIDTITSTSLSTLTVNKAHVTVTLNVEYYKPANLGDDVVITSSVIRKGKTLAFMDAFLNDKNSGELLVKGTHIKYILDKTIF